MKLAFIGGGNMGSAIIRAIINKKIISAEDITVSDVDASKLKSLAKELKVNTIGKNVEAISATDVIVLAVKPQILPGVLDELKGAIAETQLIVSIIAGATIKAIRKGLKHESVVRVMPNTPAQIGQGISAWTATEEVTPNQKKMAESILSAMGKQVYFEDEKYLDMATAVSGSGPAYIYLMIEALTDAAVHIGLPRQQAERWLCTGGDIANHPNGHRSGKVSGTISRVQGKTVHAGVVERRQIDRSLNVFSKNPPASPRQINVLRVHNAGLRHDAVECFGDRQQ